MDVGRELHDDGAALLKASLLNDVLNGACSRALTDNEPSNRVLLHITTCRLVPKNSSTGQLSTPADVLLAKY